MSVVGAFCLRHQGHAIDELVAPLVYVATAPDHVAAQEVHRRVWSQGLVPFLVVITPEGAAVCSGFSYASDDWHHLVQWFDWSAIDQLPQDPTQSLDLSHPTGELWDLRSLRLRTSLFWRDHAIDVSGRVDRRLLDSLEALSHVLIVGQGVSHSLSPAAANGLIGRFLYVYFLIDRGIIDNTWAESRGHAIALSDQHAMWAPAATWAFVEDIDSIFNGSIFPLEPDQRSEIDGTHIDLVRRVMKHGAKPLGTGETQLSFVDFYLGALRTETLSAVYEQFLENMRAGERRRVGAFYTPPYLVDFMLDRIDEIQPFVDGTTVLDPAAGSGVFLVGALRRIIERARTDQPMDLDALRGLLLRNIYGIERNRDACHVAAFSLYLTLLDYIDPRDLTRVSAGEMSEKLFPPLLGTNLFASDFFETADTLLGPPSKVNCVIGNPPWQKLKVLDSTAAVRWEESHHDVAPIGQGQAAELFLWKALREHIAAEGVIGFLLPTKSFINPTSWKFRRALARQFSLIGAANFSHLRYRLFESARQAVVGVFVRNRPPHANDRVWIYSPLSVGQPMARKESPWTLLLDRGDIQIARHDRLAHESRAWFEVFMLRPVDRHIRDYVFDRTTVQQIAVLESLCETVGARIRRGGNTSETGVDPEFLIDAPVDANAESDLFQQSPTRRASVHDVVLPTNQFARVSESYRHRFGGCVLLVPRNFTNCTRC